MFILNRSLTRRAGTAILPTGRPVQQLPSFDTSLPALFAEPDVPGLTADVLAELQKLTAAAAVDGAHGAVLDALAAEVMAPCYEAAAQHFSTSLRVIEQLDQQAIEVAATTCERALKAADEADTAESEADNAYLAHVGLQRTRSAYREATDWEALKRKLRAHRLALASDDGILGFLSRGFREGAPDPTVHTGATQLALVHTDDNPAQAN